MAAELWFFAPPEDWSEDEILLSSDESHHALHVLRVAPPDVVTVTDGRGVVARGAVGRSDGRRVAIEILQRDRHRRPKPRLAVYQGAAKGNKIDAVVERLAELGVAEMWTYTSGRSVVRWDEDKLLRLEERWGGIARAAAKQSRSPFVLEARACSWAGLLERLEREPLAVALWEEAGLPLRTALVGEAERIALVVGPEGGLAPEEAEALADRGAQLVSLGPRILRTENAAFAAASALLFHYGLVG